MNRNIIHLATLLMAMVVAHLSCKAQNGYATYTQVETECLGVEEDGSQTVRAWGLGKNKSDAKEQARKNAVRDVIFKGIRSGVDGCNMRPLVAEANAREKYEAYFNKFFRDGGDYEEFVSGKDEKLGTRKTDKSASGTRMAVTVRVLRVELKERLIRDGIIKQ